MSNTSMFNGALENGTGDEKSYEMIPDSRSVRSNSDGPGSTFNPVGLGLISMSNFTMDQALEKIHRLWEENKELRGFLKKNNEMMKEQYKNLATWKEKMRESNIQNKEKFEETRAVILNLRKENDNLKTKFQQSERSHEEETNYLKSKIKELEFGMSSLQKELEEKGKAANMQVNQENQIQVIDLQNQLKFTRDREIKLKEEKEKLRKEYVEVREEKNRFSRDCDDLCLKQQNLIKEINFLKGENAKLKGEKQNASRNVPDYTHGEGFIRKPPSMEGGIMERDMYQRQPSQHEKLQQSPTIVDEIQMLRMQNLSLMGENKELRDKEAEINKLTQQARYMEDAYQKEINGYKSEIQRLDIALRTEKQLSLKKEAEAKNNLSQLRLEYERNQNKQDQNKGDSPEKHKYLDNISALTSKMLAAEETINYKDQQLRKLRDENYRLKEENETIPAHIAQEELWKADFEAERQAREESQNEIGKLNLEIDKLRRQNNQFQEEIACHFRDQKEMQRKYAMSGSNQNTTYQRQMQNHLYVVPPSPSQSGHSPPSPHVPHTYANTPPVDSNTSRPSFGQNLNYYQNARQYSEPSGQLQFPRPTSSSSSRGSSQAEEGPDYTPLTCPKCNELCPDVDSLQLHVLDCID